MSIRRCCFLPKYFVKIEKEMINQNDIRHFYLFIIHFY